MPKVLIVYDPPPPFGGVRVSAAQTVVLLKRLPGIRFSEMKFYSHPSQTVGFLASSIKNFFPVRAVLFLVGGFMDIAGPRPMVLIALAVLLRKKIIFRGFGGGMEQEFSSSSTGRKTALVLAMRFLNLITFQTKSDAIFFTKVLGRPRPRIVWLPNTREAKAVPIRAARTAEKFCFFGKVSRQKGIGVISEAKRNLPGSVSIDIYGELEEGEEGKALESDMSEAGICYKGVVAPDRIPELLRMYDCLLLPTTWRTEGYPGVILEAFAAGIPVICTRWNALPELVDDSCGILIAPHSAKELMDAIMSIHNDAELWRRMAVGAGNRILDFNPADWSRKLHGWISEVVGAETPVSQTRIGRSAEEA